MDVKCWLSPRKFNGSSFSRKILPTWTWSLIFVKYPVKQQERPPHVLHQNNKYENDTDDRGKNPSWISESNLLQAKFLLWNLKGGGWKIITWPTNVMPSNTVFVLPSSAEFSFSCRWLSWSICHRLTASSCKYKVGLLACDEIIFQTCSTK